MARMKEKCPTCSKRRKLTIHHIHPKRFFNGKGPTFRLCRECHDLLETFIPEKTKLQRREYALILIAFVEMRLEVYYINPELPLTLRRRLL